MKAASSHDQQLGMHVVSIAYERIAARTLCLDCCCHMLPFSECKCGISTYSHDLVTAFYCKHCVHLAC